MQKCLICSKYMCISKYRHVTLLWCNYSALHLEYQAGLGYIALIVWAIQICNKGMYVYIMIWGCGYNQVNSKTHKFPNNTVINDSRRDIRYITCALL